jgi:hypothetical protein
MKYYKMVYFLTIIFGVILASVLQRFNPDYSLLDMFNTTIICYGFYHLLEWKYAEDSDDI